MTREDAINWLDRLYMGANITDEYGDMVDMQPYEEAFNMAIKALEKEPFINKPCISQGVCREDKAKVLNKIRVEIGRSKTEHEMQLAENDIKGKLIVSDIYCDIVNIIDKYKAEIEDKV